MAKSDVFSASFPRVFRARFGLRARRGNFAVEFLRGAFCGFWRRARFVVCIFCTNFGSTMEVVDPPTEITPPPPSTHHAGHSTAHHSSGKDGAAYGLPFSGELPEVHRPHGGGQRIKLQVEAGDYKFLSIIDNTASISSFLVTLFGAVEFARVDNIPVFRVDESLTVRKFKFGVFSFDLLT